MSDQTLKFVRDTLRHDSSHAAVPRRVRGFSALQIGLAVFSTGIFQAAPVADAH